MICFLRVPQQFRPRSMGAKPAVLVTRPAGQAAGLCAGLEARGYHPLSQPMLELVPLDSLQEQQQCIVDLNQYQHIIFVSGNAVDFALPWIPGSLQAFERIIIDDRQQEAAMTEPMIDADLIHGDIGELVSGKVCGRTDKMERTAFVFRSVALGDLAVAALAYQKAGSDEAC